MQSTLRPHKALFGTVALLALLAAPAAKAQETAPAATTAPETAPVVTPETTTTTTTVVAGEHFGAAGQWVLWGQTSGDLGLAWSNVDGSKNTFNLQISPALAYFVSDFVFVRLGLDLAWAHTSESPVGNQFLFGLAPGVGIAAPIKAGVNFAPWVGISWATTAFGSSVENDKAKQAINQLALDVQAPFVFDIAEHLSVSVGPYYRQDLTKKLTLTNSAGQSGDSTDQAKLGKVGIAFGVLGHW